MKFLVKFSYSFLFILVFGVSPIISVIWNRINRCFWKKLATYVRMFETDLIISVPSKMYSPSIPIPHPNWFFKFSQPKSTSTAKKPKWLWRLQNFPQLKCSHYHNDVTNISVFSDWQVILISSAATLCNWCQKRYRSWF